MISTQERGRALARAQEALRQLEQHQATSLARLGAARDQLNIVWTRTDPAVVWDAVCALEANAGEPAEERPDERRGGPNTPT